MHTTEKHSTNLRTLSEAELDEASGGSLLADVWNAYVDVYKVVFSNSDVQKYAPLEGHLQR